MTDTLQRLILILRPVRNSGRPVGLGVVVVVVVVKIVDTASFLCCLASSVAG